MREPIGDRHVRPLLRERAEDPIPDDQDAAVVAIEIRGVRDMMDAVVGQVEDPLEGPKPPGQLGVQPELIGEVDGKHGAHGHGMQSEQRQRQIEQPGAGQDLSLAGKTAPGLSRQSQCRSDRLARCTG
jgi:hypothetical protein